MAIYGQYYLFFFRFFSVFFQYICFFFNIFVFFLFFLVIHCPPGPFVARRGLFSTFLRLFQDFLSFFWLFCDFLTFFVFFSYHFHYFLTFFFQLSYLKMATNHNKDLPRSGETDLVAKHNAKLKKTINFDPARRLSGLHIWRIRNHIWSI